MNKRGGIDLNSYPHPSREYLPKSAVIIKGILNKPFMNLKGTSVLFSRGCPFKCHFCGNPNYGKTKFRNADNIINEINYLKSEYGIEALAIKDDNSIPVNRKIAKSYLEAIAKTDILWRGQTRANGIRPDIIKLAKDSGCVDIAVGIESVSQDVLNIMNKKIDINEAMKYLKQAKKQGIDTRLNLIVGLPGEPDDIAEQTINFIKEVEPSSVLFSLLCPLPGSEIYNNPKRFGMKINKDITYDDYQTAFGRYDENEKPKLVFEYEKETPFGRGKSLDEILGEHAKVQAFLRENDLIF